MKNKEKPTIAIMTFHMASNYGALLQAYALQKVISSFDVSCEILDYRLPHIYDREGVYRWREIIQASGILKGCARFIWRHLNGRYRNLSESQKKADIFLRNDLRLSSKTYFKREKLRNTKYELFIFGSDQIWNPEITGGFAPEYLGEYFDESTTALIAYAASCGKDCLPKEYEHYFVDRLERFIAIGVREKSLAKTLNEKWHISAQTVLDPVLLADPSIWSSLIEQSEIRINEPYLLVYSFDAGDDIFRIALRIAREYHLRPIAVSYKTIPRVEGIEQILNCGPKDFLYLIKHADYVCTTSFHGLAFSILFEKRFYCMANPKVGQRERDLIEMIGLDERLINKFEDLKEITDPDFTKARENLQYYRKESINFLRNSLKQAKCMSE